MDSVLSAAISIAFHGLAFAMVLYLISVGLSVTMGLMGFVNLAHGAFAMAGGYVMTTLMNRCGVPFPLALLGAVVDRGRCWQHRAGAAALSPALRRHELDQVLMTIGLIFMSVGAATYFWGPVGAADAAAGRSLQRPDRDRRPRLPDLSQLPDRLRRGRW